MKKTKWVLAALLWPSLSLAQGVMAPPQTAFKTVNGITTPIAGAAITVCAANATGVPCSPALSGTIWKDSALTQPLSNPFPADASGNYQFAAAPGQYTVTVTATGFSGYSSQISLVSSFTGGNVANATTFLGPITVNGSANLNGGGNAAIKPTASDGWFFWSASGNDNNDCTSRGTACLTWAGILSKVPAGTSPHVYITGKINVTTSGAPVIQAPIASVQSNCILEGIAAQDNQGGSGAPSTGGAIIDLTSGSGPIFDQTVTNVSFQNIVGCKIKDITFEDDPSNASTNVVLAKGGGTQGWTLDNVHFDGNGSSGEVCWEPFNATGMFTERIDFKIWLTNCTSGAKWVGTGASSDFTHIVSGSYYMLNEFANQKPIEYSDANTAQTDFAILGNVTAASGARNVIYIDDANSVMNQDLIYFHVEGDGASTTFNRINNAGGSTLGNIAMWDLGATPVGQTWADVGTVNYFFKCGSPTSLTTDVSCLFPKVGLLSSGGGTLTLQAPNTASSFTQTDSPLSGSTVVNITGSVSIASGFGTTPSIVNQGAGSGPTSIEVNVGTGGTATSGALTLPAAPVGWSCHVSDMNTNIVTRETAFSTTSVTLTAASAWTASDKLLLTCWPF